MEITIKDYIAMVCEINIYLTAFPTDSGREATKLSMDELLDLLEFGVLPQVAESYATVWV